MKLVEIDRSAYFFASISRRTCGHGIALRPIAPGMSLSIRFLVDSKGGLGALVGDFFTCLLLRIHPQLLGESVHLGLSSRWQTHPGSRTVLRRIARAPGMDALQ